MRDLSGRRSWEFLLLFSSIYLNFVSASSVDKPSPRNGTNSDSHATFGGSTSFKAFVIVCIIVAFFIVTFFLFKLWQKKKQQEQYARLLKLFEEDDELELELGLRD